MFQQGFKFIFGALCACPGYFILLSSAFVLWLTFSAIILFIDQKFMNNNRPSGPLFFAFSIDCAVMFVGQIITIFYWFDGTEYYTFPVYIQIVLLAVDVMIYAIVSCLVKVREIK